MTTETRPATRAADCALGPATTEQPFAFRQLFEVIGYTGSAAYPALGAELGPGQRWLDGRSTCGDWRLTLPLDTVIKLFGLIAPSRKYLEKL